MPYKIQVSSPENNVFWKKSLTEEEFQSIKTFTKGHDVVAIFPAALKPVRTNTLKSFSKDFFLPTVINHAINVQNAIGKFFAILSSLIFDTITFPIRLLTCIPRVIFNACQKQNLLKTYLIKEKADPKILALEHAKVRLDWENINKFPTSFYRDENGKMEVQYGKEHHQHEKNVNFIEVPFYPDYEKESSSFKG